jgi:hypothetical protein
MQNRRIGDARPVTTTDAGIPASSDEHSGLFTEENRKWWTLAAVAPRRS